MTRSGKIVGAVAALIALTATAAASAQSMTAKDVCADGKVDREKLAFALFNEAKVSYYPVLWLSRHPDQVALQRGQSMLWQILSDASFCYRGADGVVGTAIAKDGDGTVKCSSGDDAALAGARATLGLMVDPESSFGNPDQLVLLSIPARAGTPGRRGYSDTPGAVLTCPIKPEAAKAVFEEPKVDEPKWFKTFPLRLRGSTDGLQFDRADPRFAGVDKASLSLENDGIDGKRTFKVTAVLGLSLFEPDPRSAIIPYVGFNVSRTTKKEDGSVDTKTDILRAGLVASWRVRSGEGADFLVIRPEYAADRNERSAVYSVTGSYIPVRLGWLNASIPLGDYFKILPKADVRMRIGHFIDTGTRKPEDSEDFIRVGTQVGFTASSKIDWIPFEFTSTWTWLYGLEGNPHNLSQLNLVFSAYADSKKYFGIDLGYKRGRIDDLEKRADEWTIGFGAKF